MKLRNNFIKMFSLAFAVCTAFAIATTPAKAQEETASFSMVQDASIRNKEDGILGLQFSSSVNAKWLTENSAEKYTFGTLIYPAKSKASFNSASSVDVNVESLDAVSITHVQNAKLTAGMTFNASILYNRQTIIDAIEQKGLQVTDELVDEVLAKLYSKEFSARSYAIINDSVVYTNAYDYNPKFEDIVCGGTSNVYHKITLADLGYTSEYYQSKNGETPVFADYNEFISFVKDNLLNDKPVITIVTPSGGHFVTIIGYDDMGT